MKTQEYFFYLDTWSRYNLYVPANYSRWTDGISLHTRLTFRPGNFCSNKSFAHDRHENDPDVKVIRQTGQLSRRVVRMERVARRYPRFPRVVRPSWISEPVYRRLDLYRNIAPVLFQKLIQLPSDLRGKKRLIQDAFDPITSRSKRLNCGRQL